MAPIFWATLEYRSNFQKKLGSSPPDQQRLQTIRENSVLLIFESVAGFFESVAGLYVNFQHVKLTQIFIL